MNILVLPFSSSSSLLIIQKDPVQTVKLLPSAGFYRHDWALGSSPALLGCSRSSPSSPVSTYRMQGATRMGLCARLCCTPAPVSQGWQNRDKATPAAQRHRWSYFDISKTCWIEELPQFH